MDYTEAARDIFITWVQTMMFQFDQPKYNEKK